MAVIDVMTQLAGVGHDTARILAVAASEARSLTGADAGVIEILDRDGVVCEGAADGTAVRVGRPLDRESVGWQALEKRELLKRDALIAAPFHGSDGLPGLITVRSDRATAFTEEDVATLAQITRFVGHQLEQARRFEEAHRTSRRDPLTGLGNRRALDECLASELDRRTRYSGALSICLFDLDGFKAVNDTAGHQAGDTVLVRVAQRLSAVRGADSAFRLGGDEFALVMPETGTGSAELVARRLAHLVRDDAEAYGMTASWGVAEASDASDPEKLLADADARVYERKRAGRNGQASA